MSKKILILFLFLFLGLVNAEPILDQVNVGPFNSNVSSGFGAYYKVAQEFITSRMADVVLIQVPMSHYRETAGTITLEIQTDLEGNPSGSMPNSNCYAVLPEFYIPQHPDYIWIDFNIGVNCFLDENTSYWMVFSSPASAMTDTYLIYSTSGSYYPQGHFKYFNGSSWIDYGHVAKLMFKEYTNYIECYTNTGCGIDSWAGGPICQGNDVYQNYTVYTCNNPGTPESFCTDTNYFSLKQDCTDSTPYCENGACFADMPLDQRVSILEQQVESLTNQCNGLNSRVNNLELSDQSQNTQVSNLQTGLSSFMNKIFGFLSNLDFNTKQEMICGYMEDQGLTNYTVLWLYCNISNEQCTCSEEPQVPIQEMKK